MFEGFEKDSSNFHSFTDHIHGMRKDSKNRLKEQRDQISWLIANLNGLNVDVERIVGSLQEFVSECKGKVLTFCRSKVLKV